MLISIKENWEGAKVRHNTFLLKKLLKYYRSCKKKGLKNDECYKFLNRVHHLILSSKNEDYIESIVIYKKLIKDNSHTRNFLEDLNVKIRKIINYTYFSKKVSKYNAYHLCAESKIKLCPYCHHSYSITVTKDAKGFRPTLDHYYDKDSYPHLALSLYNLVPSCSNCNSSLKGTEDFYKNKHLNPFFDDELMSFTLVDPLSEAADRDAMLLKHHSELKLSLTHSTPEAEWSAKTFLIEKRYQYFVSEALTFAKAKREIDTISGDVQINVIARMKEEIILRFDRADYKNQMLGKLFLDIYNQYD